MQHEKLEQIINNESLINKETMTNLYKLWISLYVEIQMTVIETLPDPIASTNKVSMINKTK
jgi:hypothetical protein